MHRVTVITKKGCHICEDTIDALRRLSSQYHFQLETLDILDDELLYDKYWIKVPVVHLDGVDVLDVEDVALKERRMEKLISVVKNLV